MNRKTKEPSRTRPLIEAFQRAKKLATHHSSSEERLEEGTAVASVQEAVSKALSDALAQRAQASSRRYLGRNGYGRAVLVQRAQRMLDRGEDPRSLASTLKAEFADYETISTRRISDVLKEEGLKTTQKRK